MRTLANSKNMSERYSVFVPIAAGTLAERARRGTGLVVGLVALLFFCELRLY